MIDNHIDVFEKIFCGSSYPVFYDAGIQLSIINNIFDINFPIVMSGKIKGVI